MVWSDHRAEVKKLVTSLVAKRKSFEVDWNADAFCWEVRVWEVNEVGGLAGMWADA